MIIAPIIAAGAGAAICREAIFGYYERKRARAEIVMVRDRKGRLVDRSKIFERKAFYSYLAILVALTVYGLAVL